MVEVWQDRTYYKIYEKVNRQVEQYQKSREDDPAWTSSQKGPSHPAEAKWRNFIQREQTSRAGEATKTKSQKTERQEAEGKESVLMIAQTQRSSPPGKSNDNGNGADEPK